MDPADFQASSGAWSLHPNPVYLHTYAYTLIGKTMTVNFFADRATVVGSPFVLRIRVPAGKRSNQRVWARGTALPNTSPNEHMTIEVAKGSEWIDLIRGVVAAGNNWPSGTETGVYFSITFEVQ